MVTLDELRAKKSDDFSKINHGISAGVQTNKDDIIAPISFFLHDGAKNVKLRIPKDTELEASLGLYQDSAYYLDVAVKQPSFA